ncbi:MAG: acyl-CoA thioesterase [Bradymonadia bacterium]
MIFEYAFTPRFHEVDRAGIIFYGRAFQYAHVCFEEMLTVGFGDFDRVFDDVGVGCPLVHADASFSRPMRRGERLIARLQIERLSARSLTVLVEMVGADDGVLRCAVRQKHAFVRIADFTPCQCPDAFLDGLRRAGLELPEPD